MPTWARVCALEQCIYFGNCDVKRWHNKVKQKRDGSATPSFATILLLIFQAILLLILPSILSILQLFYFAMQQTLVFHLADDFLSFGKGNKNVFYLSSANIGKTSTHYFWLGNGKLRRLVVVGQAFPKLLRAHAFVQGIEQQTAFDVGHDDVLAIVFVAANWLEVSLHIGVEMIEHIHIRGVSFCVCKHVLRKSLGAAFV